MKYATLAKKYLEMLRILQLSAMNICLKELSVGSSATIIYTFAHNAKESKSIAVFELKRQTSLQNQ